MSLNYFPAVSIDTVAATSTRIFGVVPPEAKGLQVRQVDIWVATELALGTSDYWVLQLGTMDREFKVKASITDPSKGLALGRNRVAINPVVVYSRGEVMAVRALMVGSPSALTGCDVVPYLQEP